MRNWSNQSTTIDDKVGLLPTSYRSTSIDTIYLKWKPAFSVLNNHAKGDNSKK